MIAAVYLLLAITIGDTLARPVLGGAARPRRLATAFLTGILAMTWATYVGAYLLREQPSPLPMADTLVMAAASLLLLARLVPSVVGGRWRGREAEGHLFVRPSRSELLDGVLILAFTLFIGWMAGQTFWYANGTLHISTIVWSDFGPTTAIAQSFALGSNFPTEYPHFPEFPILYHFLFYFQVGNLTRLGFDPAFANNVLFVASTVSMLTLVMALGRAVFRSATAGRLGALLFFAHGSLSWVAYVASLPASTALAAIWDKTSFLSSGFPWRGEEWGIWTQATFLNQRHLAGAIGVLLVAVYFVVERYQQFVLDRAARRAAARQGKLLAEELAGQRAIERIRGDHSPVVTESSRASATGEVVAAAAPAPPPEPSPDPGGTEPDLEADPWAPVPRPSRGRATEHPNPEPGSVRAVSALVAQPAVTAEGAAPAPPASRPLPGAGVAARTLDALDELALEFQDRTRRPTDHIAAGLLDASLIGYVVVGFMLGMLPLWNSAVFVGAAAVFAVLFVLLPNRPQMVVLAIAAASVSVPQFLALRPTGLPDAGAYPQIHLGYTVEDPSLANIASYLLFTFGPKLLLASLALIAASGFQRVLFLAFSVLVGVAFGLQFSVEVFANHKFLNIWLLILNLFAAVGLLRLWFLALPRLPQPLSRLFGRTAAVVLVAVIAAGGLIDLMPIKNTGAVAVRMQGDRLFDWVVSHTRPSDIFLTDLYVTHPILLAGRAIYYGWSYYAWSAGYPVAGREELYRDILGGSDGAEIVALLHQERISYVAIDDGMRRRGFVAFLNEPALAAALGQPIFTDPDNRYEHLVIYQVPGGPVEPAPSGPSGPAPSIGPDALFTGGRGSFPGQFIDPHGIAVGPNGDVFVADTLNHRLQRFSAAGGFLAAVGGKGDQPGRFSEPNGVAVDSRGHVFVADTANHRVQELDPNLALVAAWKGPDPTFYGPRDVFIGPDDSLYVVDQGHARIVRRTPGGEVTTFGSFGSGNGQLNDPVAVAVAGDQVYVADPVNGRIQVFTTAGAFVRSIGVSGWSKATPTADVAVSPDGTRIYASLPAGGAVAVLSTGGSLTATIAPTGADSLRRPSALAVRPDGQILVVNFETPRVALLPRPGP